MRRITELRDNTALLCLSKSIREGTMKRASAYLRKGQVFLNPISKTTKGLLMTWDPLVISSEEDPELGKKVLLVLSQSTVEVPHPETLGIRSRAMAKAAGVRSYEAFADLAKCVSLRKMAMR